MPRCWLKKRKPSARDSGWSTLAGVAVVTVSENGSRWRTRGRLFRRFSAARWRRLVLTKIGPLIFRFRKFVREFRPSFSTRGWFGKIKLLMIKQPSVSRTFLRRITPLLKLVAAALIRRQRSRVDRALAEAREVDLSEYWPPIVTAANLVEAKGFSKGCRAPFRRLAGSGIFP